MMVEEERRERHWCNLYAIPGSGGKMTFEENLS